MPMPLPQRNGVLRLGLTGGIGSGKSTVAQMLSSHGAAVIDADALSRELTASGGRAMPAIQKKFGADFVDKHGALERARMRDLVFRDPQAKKMLESIIHPLVGAETDKRAKAHEAAGISCLVFDVPLLVESTHWRGKVHRVLVVDCEPATQVQRVMARSGLSPIEVESIVAKQASRLERLKAADAVVYNDKLSLTELEAQVTLLASYFGLSSGP